jgi:hypothetical protein
MWSSVQQQVQQRERLPPISRDRYSPHQQLKRPSATVLPGWTRRSLSPDPWHPQPIPTRSDLETLDEAGLPGDEPFRAAVSSHLEFGSRVAQQNSRAETDAELHPIRNVAQWNWPD